MNNCYRLFLCNCAFWWTEIKQPVIGRDGAFPDQPAATQLPFCCLHALPLTVLVWLPNTAVAT